MLRLEFQKIFRSRFHVVLLAATVIIYPVLAIITSYFQRQEGGYSDYELIRVMACAMIAYAHAPFFIPVLIIFMVSREFKNHHIHTYVFANGRDSYFISKIVYCAIVTSLFTFLGTICLAIVDLQMDGQQVGASFYLLSALHQFISHFCFSAFLMCLVFFVRSMPASVAIYMAWSLVEGILSLQLKHMSISPKWLPLHLIGSLYSRNGDSSSSKNFYNPLMENPWATVAPIMLVLVVLLASYRVFAMKDLKPLSD